MSWTVGTRTCTGTAAATADGSTTSAVDSGGSVTGSATYQCNAGTFTLQSGSTCTNNSAACTAQTVNWTVGGNTCSASYAGGNHLTSATVTDSTAPTTGSSTATCSNGSVTMSGSSCSTSAAACTAQTVNWSVGSDSCSASYAGGNSGTSATVTDSTAPTTGSSTATCTNGTVSMSGSTCATSAAACSAQTVNWTVGSNSCSANYAGGNSGTSASVTDSTAPTTGSSTATCTNGTASMSGSTCSSGAAACSAQTVNWTVGSNSCSASYTGGSSGTSATVTDSTAPTTGSSTATCSNGSVSMSGSTCSSSAAACSAQTVNWTSGSLSCSANYAGGASGTSATVTDSTAPDTGSATATCTNGSVSVSSGSCSAASSCTAGQALTWVVNSRQCTGTSTASSQGNTIAVNATGTNIGTANFQCQSNGGFLVTGSPSCNAGGSPDGGAPCASYSAGASWGGTAPGACQLNDDVPAAQSGQQVQIVDNVGVYQGQATGVCNNGVVSIISTTCYQASGAAPACAAGGVTWSVGGVTCTSGLPAGDVGATWAGVDSDITASSGTVGSNGQKSYLCTGSGWASNGSATCAVTGLQPCANDAVAWTVGGVTCNANVYQSPSGQIVNVSNLAPNKTGGAVYQCNDGVWSKQPGSTCTNDTLGCPSVFNEWSSTGFCNYPGDSARCCSATFPALAHQASATVNDSTGTSTGTLGTSCDNGARSFTAPLNCTLRCPAVPAASYVESQLGCSVGADNPNLAMSATAQGASVNMFFSNTTTSVQLRCDDPGGANGGYTFVGINTCN